MSNLEIVVDYTESAHELFNPDLSWDEHLQHRAASENALAVYVVTRVLSDVEKLFQSLEDPRNIIAERKLHA